MNCTGCNNALTKVFPEIDQNNYYQGNGVLHLSLDGAYGEYIDLVNERPIELLLCSTCADRLFATILPPLDTLLSGGYSF